MSSKKNKTVEEKYVKKTHHEHILDVPDTYIGTTDEKEEDMWIYNLNDDNGAKIIKKTIKYVPGLYKIFDEILVNARDHIVRSKTCNCIKVNIDKESGQITVWNNGDGIEVEIHKEHNIYIPEMIFGELLTSSNYDKKEKKITGGKNGYGAKLTNIYSKEFEVETLDSNNGKLFYQRWTNNMYDKEKPLIKNAKKSKSYTKISFVPDYDRFNLSGLTDDIIALMKKRVYDIAMCSGTGVKVYYNDEIIEENSFQKYIDNYFPEGSEFQKVADVSQDRWKVCVVYDPTGNLNHEVISFVNGICTYRGGNHVTYILDQITTKLKDYIKKKTKGLEVKPVQIKENLVLFIESVIENPSFNSQVKEFMESKSATFGSNFTITDAFIKKVSKTGLVEIIIEQAKIKEQSILKRFDGKKVGTIKGIPKLTDATAAGTKESGNCRLFLTEGDSAKALVMSGLNEIGNKYYGVFPLRGKLLNVREATIAQLRDNEEIANITKIMGLKQGEEYDESNIKNLRYGGIIVCTDQDSDGFHIKGLIINFIHYFWPSLVKYPEFIQCFKTPIVRCWKNGKGNKRKDVQVFYTLSDYDEWKKENNDGKGWQYKYYKGLATHNTQERLECFEDFNNKTITYVWHDKKYDITPTDTTINVTTNIKKSKGKQKLKELDEESDNPSDKDSDNDAVDDDDAKEEDNDCNIMSDTFDKQYVPKNKLICEDVITLAFDKKRADDRKIWLIDYDKDNILENDASEVPIDDFIHKELKHFSIYATIRAIPNVVDGFKPSIRKIYYGCTQKKSMIKDSIKVAQLSGFISEHTGYHHGEDSLNGAIIGMAQNFVGSNNINLLIPDGSFGTRLAGGKDAGAPRYIYTFFNPLSKIIFNSDDDNVLTQQFDDGKKIEPVYYVPIIPMLLVNGANGIGTGWSTTVYPYNPRDIVNNIRRLLAGKSPKEMIPWFRHFEGTVEKVSENKFNVHGIYQVIDDNTIRITELPVGTWTDNYKIHLNKLMGEDTTDKKGKKKDKGKSKTAKSKTTKSKTAKSKTAKSKTAKSKTAKSKGKSKKDNESDNDAESDKKSKSKRTAKLPIIKDFKEECTDCKIDFTITFNPGELTKLIDSGKLEKTLKLCDTINITNMYLFDKNSKIKKYNNIDEILYDHYEVRIEYYQKRKEFLLEQYKREMEILKWKKKFIEYKLDGTIIIDNKSKQSVIDKLIELGFPELSDNDKEPSYDYITTMYLFALTKEKIEELIRQYNELKEIINILKAKTPEQLWEEELDIFMVEYDKWELAETEEYEASKCKKKKGGRSKSKSKGKTSGRSKSVEIN
jgi:DNA topoisomerase-2